MILTNPESMDDCDVTSTLFSAAIDNEFYATFKFNNIPGVEQVYYFNELNYIGVNFTNYFAVIDDYQEVNLNLVS